MSDYISSEWMERAWEAQAAKERERAERARRFAEELERFLVASAVWGTCRFCGLNFHACDLENGICKAH